MDAAMAGDETAQILAEAFIPELLPQLTDLNVLMFRSKTIPFTVQCQPGFGWAIQTALVIENWKKKCDIQFIHFCADIGCV